MKRLFVFVMVALAGAWAKPARAGFIVGAQIHPANFFILPSGTGLSTNSNFGTGAIFAGFSAGGYLDIEAFLAQDNTGTFSGSGTLFGSAGTFNGKFKVLSYGVELKVSPPAFPLFLKAGFGLCSLTSQTVFTVAGVPAPDPFSGIEGSFVLEAGLGLSFKLPGITIFGGLDAIILKFKSSITTGPNSTSGFVYFRPNAGISIGLGK